MLNKIHEITRLLTYSYNSENKNIIDNILNTAIERSESLYYKTIVYPQLENIWSKENNTLIIDTQIDTQIDSDINNSNESSIINDTESEIDTPHSTISCSQFNYKTIETIETIDKINKYNKFNKNKLTNKQQYMLKDITVLIYIYVATQPISVFSTNQ